MKYLGSISDSKSHVTKEYVDGNILVLQIEKQDKEEGKGLSSNDYSDSDKSKVDSLVNVVQAVDTGDILDDVDVRYATEQYVDDAIANVDVDTDNLATKEELETLSERLGEKQEKLVSGENIKTFNGESVLGGGDIVAGSIVGVETGDNLEDVEMEYATKIYVDNAIAQAIISTINANY